jgi:hypothetical protein
VNRRVFIRRALTVLIALCIGIFPSFAEAANRFWVGGTGNWDAADTTHWSDSSGGAGGFSVPGASDTVTLDGSSGGGTVTVTASVSVASITAGAFTGTLNTNGQSINTNGGLFSISGSGARTVTLGASAITCGVWSAATTTNLTFNAGTSTITQVNISATFSGGGLTYATVVFTADNESIFDANTFGNLTITGTATKDFNFGLAANQTVTGTFTVNGNSATNRVLIASSVKGTARTITAATVTVTNADFQDITGAGAGSWNLSAITGGSGDCGGNSGITFTTPVTNYWIGGTGNWSTLAEWASTSGGSASSGRVPLPQDTARFDANSFSAGSLTVTQDMPRIGSVDWTGVTNTPTWTTSTVASFFGSITLVSGMTISSMQAYKYEGRTSSILTSAGKTLGLIEVNAPSGTLTLADALVSSSALGVSNGTFDANDFNVTITHLTYDVGTAQTIWMGSGTWTLSNPNNLWFLQATTTLNAETSTIRVVSALVAALDFVGSGRTYYNFENATTGAFALRITGSNTFNNFHIDASAAARTVLFTAGTTTTVASMTRDAGTNVITIGSITASSHTLTKTGGALIIPLANVSVSWSTATPSGIFFALPAGSTDGGNNSGWTFGSPTAKLVAIP